MVKIEVLASPDELAQSCAELVVKLANQAVENGRRFSIALAGGSTPMKLYTLLASDRFHGRINWSAVDLFWGDERCVPPDHPDSNYHMVYSTLLVHLKGTNSPAIFRMHGEDEPQLAAQEYQLELDKYFHDSPGSAFNLVILGMGEDGHTASLFPGTPGIFEGSRQVVAQFIPKLASWRLSLTPVVINKADLVVFLVCGAKKSAVLADVISGRIFPINSHPKSSNP